MLYRRFGRTNLSMPVITCGGMRFQESWKDKDQIGEKSQQNLKSIVHRALDLGITHFETARGYGTSEEQFGRILPSLPRDHFIVQTKVVPKEDPKKFLEIFEQSMAKLNLDYVDLLGFHGVNDQTRLDWVVKENGCMEAALKLKKQGRIRHIGFSTHGSVALILKAINDGRFDYVNLHWYYVNPFNWPAIEAAQKQDMGVFIISPNDKGGKLYAPSEKLKQLTAPLSPMLFNDLWCLSRNQVHTLSIGVKDASDFEEHLKALPYLENEKDLQAALVPIEARLTEALESSLGTDWVHSWHKGIPDWAACPGDVNIHEILRLRNFAKGLDMLEFGKMRYNLLGSGNHWFPGNKADAISDLDFSDALRSSPYAGQIPGYLEEAHQLLSGAPVKRLGSQ